jgi:hypothetical protein
MKQLENFSLLIHNFSSVYSSVFIAVDALDECHDYHECRTKFLSAIFDLQTIAGINLFATSRDIPEITAKFNRSIVVEIHATDDDVRKYVDGRNLRLPEFVGWTREQQEALQNQLREEIKTEIVKVVDGMYVSSYRRNEIY